MCFTERTPTKANYVPRYPIKSITTVVQSSPSTRRSPRFRTLLKIYSYTMQVLSTFLDSRSPMFTWFREKVGATKSWRRFYEKTREFPRGSSTEDEQHSWIGLTQIVFVKYVNSFLILLMKVFNTTTNFIWSKYNLFKEVAKTYWQNLRRWNVKLLCWADI